MKTLILLLFPVFSFGQLSLSLGLGSDFKYPVYSLQVSCDVGNLEATAEMKPTLTRNIDGNCPIGFKAGYLISPSIYAEAGYYFNDISNDRKYLNGWTPGVGFKWVKYISGDGSIFVEPYFIKRPEITFGMTVNFSQ